jgi:hypothetical protein
VIHLLLVGQELPFDVGNSRTIFYDLTLEGGEKCREELDKQITAVESDPSNIGSPVSSVIDLSPSTEENPGNPNTEVLLQIQDEVKGLKADLRYIRREITLLRRVNLVPGVDYNRITARDVVGLTTDEAAAQAAVIEELHRRGGLSEAEEKELERKGVLALALKVKGQD